MLSEPPLPAMVASPTATLALVTGCSCNDWLIVRRFLTMVMRLMSVWMAL